MLGKRERVTVSTKQALKKQKINDVKDDNKEDTKYNFADLNLDLNLVIGRNNTPINLKHYSQKMNQVQIDKHILFEYNNNNACHNIVWKNKVVMHKQIFSNYQDLIRNQKPEYCHFHQPSAKQILDMYEMAPKVLQNAESCSTILYSIHKSIMMTTAEDAYRSRNKKELQKELTNLNISDNYNNRTNNNGINYFSADVAGQLKQKYLSKKNQHKHKKAIATENNDEITSFLESDDEDNTDHTNSKEIPTKAVISMDAMIEDYGWKTNIFHAMSVKHRIAPLLLIREYLKFNFGASPDDAKQICILLSAQGTTSKNEYLKLNEIRNEIVKNYKIEVNVHVLQCIHYGIIFDCIRGYNQHLAWLLWKDRMLLNDNDILSKIFDSTLKGGKGGEFLEHTLIGKMRGIVSKINSNIVNENDKIKILNEQQQRKKIENMKQERIQFYKRMNDDVDGMSDEEILDKLGWQDPSTPDLLLSKAVMINGNCVHWMDSKNWFITHQDKCKYRKIMKQAGKYNKAFGCGAFVCLGFVKTHMKVKNDVVLLDASYWA